MNQVYRIGAFLKGRYPLLAGILIDHQKRTVVGAAAFLAALSFSVFLFSIVTAKELLTVYDAIIGGDFVVFWTAAQEAASGQFVEPYNAVYLGDALAERFPARQS